MANTSNSMLNYAIEQSNLISKLEDEIAQEWYNCSFDELDYDDKELVTDEAYDRYNGEL